jgi:hypothetical protein
MQRQEKEKVAANQLKEQMDSFLEMAEDPDEQSYYRQLESLWHDWTRNSKTTQTAVATAEDILEQNPKRSIDSEHEFQSFHSHRYEKIFPILGQFTSYSLQKFALDLKAAVILTFLSLPLAIAYTSLAQVFEEKVK